MEVGGPRQVSVCLRTISSAALAMTPYAVCVEDTLSCEQQRQKAVTVIDLRRPEAFGGAHIPGAVNIGAGQNLSLWAGWIIAPGGKLILVNDEGDDEEARRSLARVGLEHIAGFLEKGMSAWVDAGMDFAGTTQISTKAVAELDAEIKIIDVRSDQEWASGHIPDAIHIPLGELWDRNGELSKDSAIVAVCGSGYRSSIAASLLQAAGFANVSSMNRGMKAWNEQRLSTIAA